MKIKDLKVVKILIFFQAYIHYFTSITLVEVFYDSMCEKCPFMLGMNLHDFMKVPHSLDDV